MFSSPSSVMMTASPTKTTTHIQNNIIIRHFHRYYSIWDHFKDKSLYLKVAHKWHVKMLTHFLFPKCEVLSPFGYAVNLKKLDLETQSKLWYNYYMLCCYVQLSIKAIFCILYCPSKIKLTLNIYEPVPPIANCNLLQSLFVTATFRVHYTEQIHDFWSW